MRSTFKVLFYLKHNAPKKNGVVPVMCRVIVNGKVSQFSCKLEVEEKSWNVELGRPSGLSTPKIKLIFKSGIQKILSPFELSGKVSSAKQEM